MNTSGSQSVVINSKTPKTSITESKSTDVNQLTPLSKPSTDYPSEYVPPAASGNLKMSKLSSNTNDTKPKDTKRQSITSNRSITYTSGSQSVVINSKTPKTSITTTESKSTVLRPKFNYSIQTYLSQDFQSFDFTEDKSFFLSESEPPICKFSKYSVFKKSTLNKGSLLNDVIINCYLDLICKSSVRKCSYIDSLFIHKIVEGDIQTLRKWCSVDNDFDLLFCPMNINKNHWSLVVFDCINKTINNYDSINAPCMNLVKSVSTVLSKVFKKLNDLSLWKVNTAINYPMQIENLTDCGVFLCLYAKSLAFNSKFNFSQSDILSIRKNMQDDIINFCLDFNIDQ
ncbi:unnamed protein product [Brachionus calyciflorus]|uniref:Ubiquitin-like protease family profile domain-containing protein n=1 Tax=Brachionus calyciflorus TaxID=104777 RepID=A0A814DNM9_9BILA|nr:unnamed protein product [Brachionus calyciflorus]